MKLASQTQTGRHRRAHGSDRFRAGGREQERTHEARGESRQHALTCSARVPSTRARSNFVMYGVVMRFFPLPLPSSTSATQSVRQRQPQDGPPCVPRGPAGRQQTTQHDAHAPASSSTSESTCSCTPVGASVLSPPLLTPYGDRRRRAAARGRSSVSAAAQNRGPVLGGAAAVGSRAAAARRRRWGRYVRARAAAGACAQPVLAIKALLVTAHRPEAPGAHMQCGEEWNQ